MEKIILILSVNHLVRGLQFMIKPLLLRPLRQLGKKTTQYASYPSLQYLKRKIIGRCFCLIEDISSKNFCSRYK